MVFFPLSFLCRQVLFYNMKTYFIFAFVFSLVLLCGCLGRDCGSPGDCPTRTCFSVECIGSRCVYSPISGCCGNDVCEPGEGYGNCSSDCPDCDDLDECTRDVFDFHRRKCVNTPILDVVCCGNGLCEVGESFLDCARDCPDCDDGNICTRDGFDFHRQVCVNTLIVPCCGDGFCDEDTESSLDCLLDCPSCDDNYALTVDIFNYSTQKCSNSPLLLLAEGFRYSYVTAHCRQCPEHDSFIYVTEESDRFWKGVSAIKLDETGKAYLSRWRVDRGSLDLSITFPLPEDGLSGDVVYLSDVREVQAASEVGDSVLPFYLLVLREMFGLDLDELFTAYNTGIAPSPGQTAVFSTSDPVFYGDYPVYRISIDVYQDEKLTDSGFFVVSAVGPYLMLDLNVGDGPRVSFRGAEERDFSLDDFEGFVISEWSPPLEPKPPKK
jgi:hypothetical protein